MTHKKRVIFSVLLTSVLVSLSMISACAKDGDIEMDLLQCQLRIEPSNPYQYLGEDETYEVTCDNPDSLPKNPVYEWTFQSEDKTVLDTYIYRKSGDFIKTDVKDYEFKKEGTNTIRVDLYEEDEFDVAGNLAPHRGTVTVEVNVEAIRVSIESMAHGVGNIYTLNAKVDNPQYLPGQVEYSWNLGDNSKEQKGNLTEITHEFPEESTYTVKLTLLDPYGEEVCAQVTKKVVVGEEVEGTDIALRIDPEEITWETGRGINFTVEAVIPESITPEMLPESIIWEWDFGDDSDTEQQEGKLTLGSMATHPYTNVGEYEVHVTVCTAQTKEKLAEVKASVLISDLLYLKKTNRLSVYLSAWKNLRIGANLDGSFTQKDTSKMSSEDGLRNDAEWPLEWVGQNKFEAERDWTTQDGVDKVWKLTGQVDATGTVIIWVTVTEKYNDPDYYDPGREWSWHRMFSLNDIRISKLSGGDAPSFYKKIDAEEVRQHVSDYYYLEIMDGWYGDEGDKQTKFDTFDWTETSMPAKIEIRFWTE